MYLCASVRAPLERNERNEARKASSSKAPGHLTFALGFFFVFCASLCFSLFFVIMLRRWGGKKAAAG